MSVSVLCSGSLIHQGLRWDEVRDPLWDTPGGRVFRVYNFSQINSLQDKLEPGDVMVMSADGYWAYWHDGSMNL